MGSDVSEQCHYLFFVIIMASLHIHVVFIPFWYWLFIAFIIGEFIFMIIVILSNVLSDNQQQINDRRLPYSMLLVCAAVFTTSLIIFMVRKTMFPLSAHTQ